MTVGASIPKLSYSILGDFENMVNTDALQLQISKEIDTRQPGTYSNAIHISGAVIVGIGDSVICAGVASGVAVGVREGVTGIF